jgi:hypothetical protein
MSFLQFADRAAVPPPNVVLDDAVNAGEESERA